jgi:hypothetical protein
MWQDAKKSFTQMNVNGNLQNGIGIQMGQVKTIEIKEAAEKVGNGESETAEKKGLLSAKRHEMKTFE